MYATQNAASRVSQRLHLLQWRRCSASTTHERRRHLSHPKHYGVNGGTHIVSSPHPPHLVQTDQARLVTQVVQLMLAAG
jgi:hypothetical protein